MLTNGRIAHTLVRPRISKVFGTTPTTVHRIPSILISWPTMAGSRLKRDSHNASLITMTWRRFSFVLGHERAAGDRLDAEHVEDARRHPLARHRFGVAVAAGHHHAADVRRKAGDRLERPAARVPVEHVRRRREASRVRAGGLPDRDQPIRVGVRQRPQQRRVDQREDRAVGADAERERQSPRRREHRRRTQLAERELHVVTQLFEPLADSHLTISLSSEVDAGLFDGGDVAHPLERELARRSADPCRLGSIRASAARCAARSRRSNS